MRHPHPYFIHTKLTFISIRFVDCFSQHSASKPAVAAANRTAMPDHHPQHVRTLLLCLHRATRLRRRPTANARRQQPSMGEEKYRHTSETAERREMVLGGEYHEGEHYALYEVQPNQTRGVFEQSYLVHPRNLC